MDFDKGPENREWIVIPIWMALSVVSVVWMYFQAQAAVKVRPNLAEVGVVDAFLTGHGFDWVFYHNPVIGSVLVVGFFGLVSIVYHFTDY